MQDNPFAVPEAERGFITEEDFASLYAAVAFAETFQLLLDTHVSITWELLGCHTREEVKQGFESFTSRFRAWCRARKFPAAYVYVHENGKTRGPHTHMLVHIPGPVLSYRRDFRRWVSSYAKRNRGHSAPNAIRVTGPSCETPWVQWLLFNYLVKGYDREAVVRSAARAPGGREIRLGDLIAFHWQDPGPIVIPKHVGASRSLDVEQRKIGVPTGFEDHLPRRVSHSLRISERNKTDYSPWLRPDQVVHGPFRSKYDDGVCDVRELYPVELWAQIVGEQATLPTPEAPDLEEIEAWWARLAQQEYDRYGHVFTYY